MLKPDTVLQNRYRIVRQLGQGGMGTVYEAKALRLNTTVALKETHFTDERLRKQFEREAQLLASLRHPALPRVIDHFDESAGLYLVMDFIEGDDLWEMLQKRSGAFPVAEVLGWAEQLLEALAYLHSQDPPVIHRDIKPQNLKLSGRGQIILLDFGLAKGLAGHVTHVTTSGSVFGFTPNYAPLEQIQGTGTDARSDLYSLAATLYHLTTRTVPPDVLTRVTATTDGQPDPLRSAHEVNQQVPQAVAEILSKAMAIGRTQRFPNACEMREALCRASEIKKEAGRDRAESLPPTVFDGDISQRAKAPSLDTTVAPEFDVADETRKQAEAAAQRQREAEEAVFRAARERARQEEAERQQREAAEAQRKAEIRRQREEQQRQQEEQQREEQQREREEQQRQRVRSEPVPPVVSQWSGTINWYGLGLAIIAGGILALEAPDVMNFFVRAGGIFLYPLVSCLLLGALFGFYLPKIKWRMGLCLSVSYFVFYWRFRGFWFFLSYQLVLSLAGALTGANIGARLAQRKRSRRFSAGTKP